MNKEYEVIFLDCVPRGEARFLPKMFEDLENLSCLTYFYPHRKSGGVRLLIQRLRSFLSRGLFMTLGWLHPSALSTRTTPLEKLLEKVDADVYMGHHIDTLLPIYRMAKRKKALMIFDCYECYSDMGDGQAPLEQEIVRRIEGRCLDSCDLVLASSDQLADELVNVYGIRRPLPLYNVPAVELHLPEKENQGFTLYWRNNVLGLGQRGLGDALVALTLLPGEITLLDFSISGLPPCPSLALSVRASVLLWLNCPGVPAMTLSGEYSGWQRRQSSCVP